MSAARLAWITGVNGFIGQYVARLLFAQGWKVVGIGRAVRENAPWPWLTEYVQMSLPASGLKELLDRTRPEVIFHCAGRASVEASFQDPLTDYRENSALVVELLDALRTQRLDAKFVLVSSAAVYGNPEVLPVSESEKTAPVSPYGYHKLSAELVCRSYSQLFGVRTAVARVFSAYGMGLRRQVVWDICRKAVLEPEVTLRGTGQESRDFIHVKDVALALLALAESGHERGQVVNVASGVEVTIAELARLLVSQIHPKKSVVFSGNVSPGNPVHWRADVGELRKLGFSPRIPIESGMRDVAEWVKRELEP